ncbi:MAG: CoA-binding protein [Gemmatimonadetes bacterium]|nr:CoA-binding protein [Gemmatimonadota bacterium]
MEDWRRYLVEDDDGVARMLGEAGRIAVLGIKPESRAARPAHYVPKYMKDAGYELVPVPVYYPDVSEILGLPVYRKLVDIPGDVDLVNVFRKPKDIPPHVDDIIAKAPAAVWFQLGIRNDAAAERLARAGIRVVQDKCIMVEHRRLVR